ncbi:MAG: hypothetical protein IT167_10175 [Bryobacterales bacterium]|nr:hypothetical protein [Bryobacterales bacterium]
MLFPSLTVAHLHRMGKAIPPAISVLLPGCADGSGAAPNSLRLRQAVDEIFRVLVARGWAHHEVAHLVAPLLALSNDPNLCEGRKCGMALYLSRGGFHCFEIPAEVRETVVVSTHFYIRPLLEWLTAPRDFLILELSAAGVGIKRASNGMLTEVVLPRGVPTSLEEIASSDAPDHAQVSRNTGKGPPPSSAISFGISSANEERRIRFFCTMLDRGLHSYLQDLGLPVVLAGSGRMVNIYRKENTYPATIIKPLHGDVESMAPEELLERARGLVGAEKAEQAVRHLAEMEEYAPGDRWSTTLESVLRGAASGRVSRLFLASGGACPGDFHEELGDSVNPFPVEEDLINAIAIETLAQGGELNIVPSDQLPAHAQVVALFRYSMGSVRG